LVFDVVAKFFDGFDVFFFVFSFECCLFIFFFGWMFGIFFNVFAVFLTYVVIRVKQVDHEGISGFELPEPYHGWGSLQPLLNSLRWRWRGRERERCLLCPSMGISQLDATGGSSHGSFPGTMHSHGGALQLYVNPGYRVTTEANVFSKFHQFFVDMIFDECDSNKSRFPM
jgi:hypothetical protein